MHVGSSFKNFLNTNINDTLLCLYLEYPVLFVYKLIEVITKIGLQCHAAGTEGKAVAILRGRRRTVGVDD